MTARTVTELRELFWQYLRECAPELADCYRKTYRQNRYSATIRCYWVDFIDAEQRRGNITEALADRATL